MIDVCLGYGSMVIIGPENDDTIINACEGATSIESYEVGAHFKKVVSAHTDDVPVKMTFVMPNREEPFYLVPVNEKIVITNADKRMMISTIGVYKDAVKWNL